MAALWTDAHASYAFNVAENASNNVHQTTFGSPCIRLTASISALPLVSTQLENYMAGKTYKSGTATKELLALLSRCTQSGSRGWEPALRACLANDVVKTVVTSAFVACCIGMHPQIHPGCRPTWDQRLLARNVLETTLHGNAEDALCACNLAVKESIRIYMCSLQNDTPASRAARRESGHSIGLLTSCPVQVPHPALQAASQHLVKAGTNALKALLGDPSSSQQPSTQRAVGG